MAQAPDSPDLPQSSFPCTYRLKAILATRFPSLRSPSLRLSPIEVTQTSRWVPSPNFPTLAAEIYGFYSNPLHHFFFLSNWVKIDGPLSFPLSISHYSHPPHFPRRFCFPSSRRALPLLIWVAIASSSLENDNALDWEAPQRQQHTT